MIVFEKIRWKNFLSTGNQFTELGLNEDEGTLIIGNNGAGKSTMLDALCFCLFNKPFRKISKGLLVNTVNEKDCVVEVEFRIGTIEYKVVRGIKPGILEIYRQGNLLDQDAANRDYQKYLEQNILKLNYKSFTQVVILGSSTFVPFMQLPAGHRREVVEDLLDIQVFSHMNMLLKERIKDNNESLRDCKYELQIADERIISQCKTLNSLTAVNDKRIELQKGQFDLNEERMLDVKRKKDKIEQQIIKLDDSEKEFETLEQQYGNVKDLRSRLQGKLERTTKDFEFFQENSSCPMCTQDIEETFRTMKIGILGRKKDEVLDATEQLKEELVKIRASMALMKDNHESVMEYRFEVQSRIQEEKRLMKTNTDILSTIKDLSNQPDITGVQEELDKLRKEYEEKESACADVNKLAADYKLAGTLLKDGGIKAKIISKYIPIINQSINRHLSNMDTYINFTLDEEFQEVIKSRYRDKFSYSSFSEGEKQKIDLALLFTWRHVAKLKNSITTNLLILDEVFDSSLDAQSTEELFKILKNLDSTNNIFVISHKSESLTDKFNRTLRFAKVNGFSKIIEDV